MSQFGTDDINQILSEALSLGLNRFTKPSIDIQYGVIDPTKPNGVKTNIRVTVAFSAPSPAFVGLVWLNADSTSPTYKTFYVGNGTTVVPAGTQLDSTSTITKNIVSVIPATTTTLGGIIVGNGLAITLDGKLSATGGVGVSNATASVPGVIQLTGDLGGTSTSPTVPGLAGKQATLVSGTNIKTVGSHSLLGSGDINLVPSDIGAYAKPGTGIPTSDLDAATQLAISKANSAIQSIPTVPSATSSVQGLITLTGDLGGTASSPTVPGLANKQATLVSGTNIKTVGSKSLVGSGDLGLLPSDIGAYVKPGTGIPSTDLDVASQTGLAKALTAVQTLPAATSSVAGIIQLTGDLGGTSASPTVPGLANKQDTLVSGTNVKTINGASLLGSGNLVISVPTTTDALSEGTTNLYFTQSRVLATTITGVSTAVSTPITAADTTLAALGKLQAQLTNTQPTLVSGTSIKTINGSSILGSGNLTVSGSGGGGSGPTSTDGLPEGTTNLYFTQPRVLSTTLAGLSTSTPTPITSSDTTLSALGKLQAQFVGVNHAPVVNPASGSFVNSVVGSGNIITSYVTDLDSNTCTVSWIDWRASYPAVGTPFTTLYGTMTINANGSWTYVAGAGAWALLAGQNVTDTFTYLITDGQGAQVPGTLTVNIQGSAIAPTITPTNGGVQYNTPVTGSVASSITELSPLTVTLTQFTVAGVTGTFTAGATATITGVGTITMGSNMSYTFTPVSGYYGPVPIVTYSVTNGTETVTGTLGLTVAIPQGISAAKLVKRPSITGTGNAGDVLTYVAGTVTGATGAPALQWMRQGHAIPGATGTTYTTTTADTWYCISLQLTYPSSTVPLQIRTYPIEIGPATQRTVVDYTLDPFVNYKPWSYEHPLPNQNGMTSAYAGTVYEVGPGKAYSSLHDVPIMNLLPGDTVKLYWRSTPYSESIFIPCQGEPNRWIKFEGVPGPLGQLPILDGTLATSPPPNSGLSSSTDGAAMIQVGTPTYGAPPFVNFPYSRPSNYKAGWIWITKIQIQNAKVGQGQITLTGQSSPSAWILGASGIAQYGTYRMHVDYCRITNCGWGIFSRSINFNSQNDSTREDFGTHYRFNYIDLCGVPYLDGGRAGQHNIYNEALGAIFEYNYLDSPVDTGDANNIKTRDCGTILRYNFIRNGTNNIWIMEPENNPLFEASQVDAWGEKLISKLFIYGNTFVIDRLNYYNGNEDHISVGDGPFQGNTQYRFGSFHYYNNIMLNNTSTAQAPYMPLFNLLDASAVLTDGTSTGGYAGPVTTYVINNLFYTTATAGGTPTNFALFYCQGYANWSQNWINGTYENSYASVADGDLANGVPFTGVGLGGLAADNVTDPGFYDIPNLDLRLHSTSPFYSLTGSLHNDAILRGLVCDDSSVYVPYGYIAPVNTVLPTLSGSFVAGGTVNFTTGTWDDPSYTFTVTPLVNGVAQTAVTGTSFVIPNSAGGGTIAIAVLAQNPTSLKTATINSASHNVTAASGAPTNTSPPVFLTGSHFYVTGTATWGSDTWSTSLSGESYSLIRDDGVNVATGTSYTFVLGDQGHTFTIHASVYDSSGRYNTATSTASASIAAAPALEPDSNGIFQWNEASGALLPTLSSKLIESTPGSYQTSGTGTLETTSAAGFNSVVVQYENGQGATQASCGVVAGGVGFSGSAGNTVYLYIFGSTGYAIVLGATNWQLTKAGSFVTQGNHGINISTTSIKAALKYDSTAGTINVYVATGATVFSSGTTPTYTASDSSPPTGNYPGFMLYPGANNTTVQLDSWSDSLY